MRHIAIIGAGPSGIYAADDLARVDGFQVDVIDRLPTPYGLVRYGVAPDHIKMKSVTRALEKVFSLPGVRFLGNVEIGRDITAAELRSRYDAVVWAVGAPGYRRLDVPGEDLPGVVPAPDLVAWYSAHPDAVAPPALDGVTSVVVVGAGNVALDVARLLAKAGEELHVTDIPDAVIGDLAASKAQEIHVVARRGPADVKFTHKELAELGELVNADVVVHASDEVLAAAEAAALSSGEHVVVQNVATFREWSEREPGDKPRTVHFHFGLAASRIEGGDWVQQIVFRSGSDEVAIPAELVVTAIGSFGRPVPGVPFDADRGVVPHEDGRVSAGTSTQGGEYVVGWAKRGPTGIIGTNKSDANATVKVMLADFETAPEIDARPLSLDEIPHVVTWDAWLAIDGAEVELGRAREAARQKLATWEVLLEAAGRPIIT